MALATLACIALSRILYRKQSDIPMADGAVPILGHALAYKDDPATFLSSQTLPVFRINLAGREMIVVGRDVRAMKQVATLPESVLSARQAVADIGFEYTLGKNNVHIGTDWHKRILKDYIYSSKDVCVDTFPFLVKAVDVETKLAAITASNKNDTTTVLVNDLFDFARRCMLRAMLTYMIAPSILDGENADFLESFMLYQDKVEDATAKAAILPRFLSVSFILKPVEKQRLILTKQLATMIHTIWNEDSNDMGPWLTAFQRDNRTAPQAAELTMGLMFAAHKNPAIGVSQCFCYLQTKATPKQQETAMVEAKRLYESYSDGESPNESYTTLRHCVLETLRLTAHSIGGIRTAQKDIILETTNGDTFSVRKGDVIALAHIATHRDPRVWGSDVQDYNQDRWLSLEEENTTTSIPVNEYKYTTFSHGVHKCPGEALAISMMQLMLAILLVREAKLVDSKDTLAKVSFERATLAQRDGNVPITIDKV